jgi:hypothetical protein
LTREQGRLVVEAAVRLDAAIGDLDGVISDITDVEWRKQFVESLARVIDEVYVGMIRPVTKIYPDLDPYKAE